MGEYAFRKSDKEHVKIGTCESMYYLRYDDRFNVIKENNSLDPATEMDLFWRLPFPDEDSIGIGNYEIYNRGLRLYEKGEYGCSDPNLLDEDTDTGIIQLKHECGLLVNVPCFHGMRLPEAGPDVKVFWNGKSWFLELAFIKNTSEGLKPVVRCRHCQRMWRFDWSEILPYVHGDIKPRLEEYAKAVLVEAA